MRNILALVVCVLAIFFLVTNVFAQETPEEVAAKYGITFPIGQLGNCANYQECRTFCDDPVNADKCIAFAKEKGFYKEDSLHSQKDAILASAQSELGCDSFESCQSYCESEANFDECNSFAQRHSLGGGYTADPHEQEFIEKAKEVLGCDSPQSCMTYCQNESNWQKCSEFARQVGLSGGHETKGPDGCSTAETCQAYCSEPANFETCSKYSSQGGSQFSGPGGCNSEESCRTYCQAHPNECGYHSGEGSTTNYQDYESFCRQYPEKCTSVASPTTTYEDYCSKYPDKCVNPSPTYTNPEDYCKQYPDKCNQTQSSPAPTYESHQDTYTQPSYDPASECQKSGGSWTGSICQQVQGASTQGNFLLRLVQSLLDLF